MYKFHTTKLSILALLIVTASAGISAGEIYHWVDKDGVPHYSQHSPGEDVTNVSKQKLEDASAPGDGAGEDIYNVKEHQERMAEWREERDQKREDARKQKRLQEQQQSTIYYQPQPTYERSFWFPPYYGRPPHRPPVHLPSPGLPSLPSPPTLPSPPSLMPSPRGG